MEKVKDTEAKVQSDPLGPPWKSGVILVKHEVVKDNAMVMGGAYGVIIGLLAALVISGALRRT